MEDTEVSKICLEYWNALSADLYRESPFRSLIINYCAPDPDPCSMTFWIRIGTEYRSGSMHLKTF